MQFTNKIQKAKNYLAEVNKVYRSAISNIVEKQKKPHFKLIQLTSDKDLEMIYNEEQINKMLRQYSIPNLNNKDAQNESIVINNQKSPKSINQSVIQTAKQILADQHENKEGEKFRSINVLKKSEINQNLNQTKTKRQLYSAKLGSIDSSLNQNPINPSKALNSSF